MADSINSIAEQAIGLFVEYRDVHGYSEESARNQALIDLAEGASVEIPEDHPADCVCDAHSVEELMRRPSHAVIPMPDADLDAIRRRDADEGTATLTEGERRVLDAVARTYPSAARAFARLDEAEREIDKLVTGRSQLVAELRDLSAAALAVVNQARVWRRRIVWIAPEPSHDLAAALEDRDVWPQGPDPRGDRPRATWRGLPG